MTEYANGHPVNDKAALAEWMKYPTVEEMDADHDDMHVCLTDCFGLPSYSLRKATGESLTATQEDLAACEEAAVLHVQRWFQWSREANRVTR